MPSMADLLTYALLLQEEIRMVAFVRKMLVVLSIVAVIMAIGNNSYAISINGSLGLAGVSPALNNGSNLGNTTSVSSIQTIVTDFPNGFDDYSVVPFAALFGPTTVDLTNLSLFSISNPAFGSFTAASGTIVTQLVNFLDVLYLGTFTPANSGPLSTFDPTASSLRVSINQSGSALAEAITLTSTPTAVPEPSTWLLLTTGTLLLGYGWRRHYQQ
jgi:hypothetical protein